MITIRPFQEADWPALRPILHSTIATGDTFAFAPDSSAADMHHAWIAYPAATLVACTEDGRIVGSYYIKPNQPGLGAHVCNCGYVVALDARGLGVASAMCQHSQQLGREMGFLAMQFNLVVSTNLRAVQLWQRLGFATIGTLPKAFRHQQLGLVDALVMFKSLT